MEKKNIPHNQWEETSSLSSNHREKLSLLPGRADYHLHPGYSVDADPATVRQYCARALELDLQEICFTPHLEHETGRPNTNNLVRLHGKQVSSQDLRWLEAYFTEIEEAREEFQGSGLEIRVGIEIGYGPHLDEFIEKVLREFSFDFVLGAVHSIYGISISSIEECPEYFSLCSLEDLRKDYFRTLELAIQSGFFDCLAHLDIYRRYGYEFYGEEILTIHRGVLGPLLEEAARRRMGVEINTSSIRRGGKEFHPSREILAMAEEAGVDIFTVGSDAHSPEELGTDLEPAYQLLEEAGQPVYIFRNRIPQVLPSPGEAKGEKANLSPSRSTNASRE